MRSLIFVALVILLASPVLRAQASAVSQEAVQKQLSDYLSELATSTSSYDTERAVREKIIKWVAGLPSPPPLPEDAEKHGFKGDFLAKSATTPEDFEKAADEYFKASFMAPWIAQYYENYAIVLEKADKLEKAKFELELYLLAAPNASDRADVRRRIAEIEVKIDRESDAAKVAQQKQAEDAAAAAKRDDLSGIWIDQADGKPVITIRRSGDGYSGELPDQDQYTTQHYQNTGGRYYAIVKLKSFSTSGRSVFWTGAFWTTEDKKRFTGPFPNSGSFTLSPDGSKLISNDGKMILIRKD